MPHNFKPLQFHRLEPVDACFLLGDIDLLLHGIYAIQIREQQSTLADAADDDAVAFYLQFDF